MSFKVGQKVRVISKIRKENQPNNTEIYFNSNMNKYFGVSAVISRVEEHHGTKLYHLDGKLNIHKWIWVEEWLESHNIEAFEQHTDLFEI